MREYAKITAGFWIGSTGRSLRGDPAAQVVAAYLLSAPASSMIGVYYCPVATIANDTGIGAEGASMALRRVCEAGFATYDPVTEWVWVHEMARHQIEGSLSPKDKRVVGIAREFEKLPESPLKQGFYDRYRHAFHLPKSEGAASFQASPFGAPSKPHRSQEQEHEQEQEQEQEQKELSQGAGLTGLGTVGDRARAAAAGPNGRHSPVREGAR